MTPASRFPNFNEPPFTSRMILSMYGTNPLVEVTWLAIPVILFILGYLFG